MSPTSISSSLIRSGTKRPTSLSRMKVPIAEKAITHARRVRLDPEQVEPTAGDQAFVFARHQVVGEDPDQKAADDAGEPVRVDHAEGVVDVAERTHPAQVVERQIDDRRGDDADDDRAPAVDETGAGGDRDEADDHPVDGLPIRLGLRPVR